MSDMGVGCPLRRTERTVPFATVTTLSAIGVIAWLCVMMTTVVPMARQVS